MGRRLQKTEPPRFFPAPGAGDLPGPVYPGPASLWGVGAGPGPLVQSDSPGPSGLARLRAGGLAVAPEAGVAGPPPVLGPERRSAALRVAGLLLDGLNREPALHLPGAGPQGPRPPARDQRGARNRGDPDPHFPGPAPDRRAPGRPLGPAKMATRVFSGEIAVQGGGISYFND